MAVSESTRAPNRPSQFVAALMAIAGLVLSCGAIVLLIMWVIFALRILLAI